MSFAHSRSPSCAARPSTLRDPDAGPTETRVLLHRKDRVAKAEQTSRLVDEAAAVRRAQRSRRLSRSTRPRRHARTCAGRHRPRQPRARASQGHLDPSQASDGASRCPGRRRAAATGGAYPDRQRGAHRAARQRGPRHAQATEGHAVVTVSDDGPGFAAEEVERAFSRFWQGRPGTKGKGRGSGLGLSIARSILERHDGAIRLENHEGGGATVRLEVPLDPGTGGEDGDGRLRPPASFWSRMIRRSASSIPDALGMEGYSVDATTQGWPVERLAAAEQPGDPRPHAAATPKGPRSAGARREAGNGVLESSMLTARDALEDKIEGLAGGVDTTSPSRSPSPS